MIRHTYSCPYQDTLKTSLPMDCVNNLMHIYIGIKYIDNSKTSIDMYIIIAHMHNSLSRQLCKLYYTVLAYIVLMYSKCTIRVCKYSSHMCAPRAYDVVYNKTSLTPNNRDQTSSSGWAMTFLF